MPCNGLDPSLGQDHFIKVSALGVEMQINNHCLHKHCSRAFLESQNMIQQLTLAVKTS